MNLRNGLLLLNEDFERLKFDETTFKFPHCDLESVERRTSKKSKAKIFEQQNKFLDNNSLIVLIVIEL